MIHLRKVDQSVSQGNGCLFIALLYEVAPRHAGTLAATGLVLVAVALLAPWLAPPGATQVDPVVALRYE